MRKKQLLALLACLIAALTVKAADEYELSARTSLGDWTFNNGFSISNEAGKNYTTGKNNGIKYSRNVQYTIHIPDGISIRRAKFYGYDNYDDADAFIKELGGVEYGETDYVFPKKNESGDMVYETHTIVFDQGLESSLTFTPGGQQVVWIITLYTTAEDEPGPTADTNPLNTPVSQMEKLDRGLIALKAKSGGGQFVSWRLLGTDDEHTSFDLLRDGVTIKSDLKVTNYTDPEGTTASGYQVVVKQNGIVETTTPTVYPWGDKYKRITLDRPSGGTNNSGSYTYTPNDCSVGDVDGNGEYELFVKWDPSNSKDNSQSGYTGNVYIDCVKMDGTHLWRIDLGTNIRAGAHYTQFMVYDFDGDGKAELICKTAPGSKDGLGNYVTAAADDDNIKNTDNTKAYHNSEGYVLSGPEYLTVFNGETGAAVHTVFHNPNRAGEVGGAPEHPAKSFWGDNYGNRCDRYLAGVAYLDGPDKNPSAVMCRGYYTRSYLWAVDFDGQKLSTKWLHSSISSTEYNVTDGNGTITKYTGLSNTAFGQGCHNLSVADVDGDGCDEVTLGSAAVDHDGRLLYSTGLGHGDAQHLSDLDPDRPGLEFFMVHESSPFGLDIHDAATGVLLTHITGSKDTGRGMAADIDATSRGFEYWSAASNNVYDIEGNVLSTSRPSQCFRLYWTGDLQDELFDGKYNNDTGKCAPIIQKWNTSTKKINTYLNLTNVGNSQTCNTTKATPCLLADILGDWREEIVMWDYSDGCTLNIFSTNEPTEYPVPTLMHDHTYRMGIAWQNTSYNQPAHLGYYLPDLFKDTSSIMKPSSDNDNQDVWFNINGQRVSDSYKGLRVSKKKKILIK